MREIVLLMQRAAPLVLAMLGQIAIATTDVIMLGWYGAEALAASALALSIFHPVMLMGIGITSAVTPLAAQALARHRLRQARRSVRQGLWAVVPMVVVATPPCWFLASFLVMLGQDAALSHEAEQYMRGAIGGLAGIFVYNVLRSYATALERTNWVFVITLAAIPLNALLNYALIFGEFGSPELGVLGAGIGSALTNTATAIAMALVVAALRPFRRHVVFGNFWRPDWPAFAAIFRLGTPIGLAIVLEVGVFAAAAQLMGLIGTLELAAHQIAIQLASITFMVPLGIGQAATARVGLAYGRAGLPAARRAGIASMLLALGFMSLTALAFWTMPEWLIRPFLDDSPQSARVLQLAASFLALAAIFQIADGLQVTAIHALRGLGDTRIPLYLAILGYWGIAFIACWLLAFPLGLAGVGIWAGLALGLIVMALLLSHRFAKLTRPTVTA